MLSSGVLKGQDPLQRYGDFSALPMEGRRVTFSNASSKDKSDLFRTHLALYLARHSKLSESQKQIILEGMALATPELYELRSDKATSKGKVEEPLRQFEDRVRSVFSKEEGARIFAELGDPATQDDLLQKYRDISALPMQKRRLAFRQASAQDRADLWRTHLALYLAKHPELNPAQKEITMEGMSLATREWFEMRFGSPDWKVSVGDRLTVLDSRIRSVFSKEEGARIFATLGDPEPLASSSRLGSRDLSKASRFQGGPQLGKYNVWTVNRFIGRDVELAEATDCECTTRSDWCANYCGGGKGCTFLETGCGTFWQYPSSGMCVPLFE